MSVCSVQNKNRRPADDYYFGGRAQGLPRHKLCLRGIRDGSPALCLALLLIVEPTPLSRL